MKWRKLNKWVFSFFAFFMFCGAYTVDANANAEPLIPMGHSIGIQMELEGVYLSSDTMPEKDLWLRMGDRITAINRKKITKVEDVETSLRDAEDHKSTLTIDRQGKEISLELTADSLRQLIPLLKNETEGTGTLTYVDPKTKTYGALGHQIIDSTFDAPPQFKKGAIFLSTIDQIKKSAPGRPGYKISTIINDQKALGSIEKNSLFGIYGDWNTKNAHETHPPIETVNPTELRLGEAELLTTISGTKVETFTIEITEINHENFSFVIKDEALLKQTGGVLQGMSGSPILQHNKFAGAVTHMFVDEPTEGAALSIIKMRKEQ